jgi:hypothetical protein
MYSRGVVERGISQPPNRLHRASLRPCGALEFLIANPRLEFRLTRSKLSSLKIPNRKYFAICCSHRAAAPSGILPATRHLSLATGFLIDTPRSEIHASTRKERLILGSNRDNNGASLSAFHSPTRSVFRCLRGQTLTLREPQSNLAASCFVRARAGEYSQ